MDVRKKHSTYHFPDRFDTAGHTVKPDMPAMFIDERSSERLFIAFDPEGDIRFTSATLRDDNILVILGRNVTEEHLAHLHEMRISYILIGDATDLSEGFKVVGCQFGIRSVSVQGQHLQLLSVEQREYGVIWLRYEFYKNKP